MNFSILNKFFFIIIFFFYLLKKIFEIYILEEDGNEFYSEILNNFLFFTFFNVFRKNLNNKINRGFDINA